MSITNEDLLTFMLDAFRRMEGACTTNSRIYEAETFKLYRQELLNRLEEKK